ncbi:ABC transporter substrate-binding protein [Geodermatophilus ruber]|uniref:ABC-type nitrate/sulfonate/bicarbonate transport system, substrate-binding protein n=1 Tax=Geodermatophilus ruber TaxID=504800 RepID=A0A1I4C9M8_9ACTN|nr:ABC transporter substrate-binding protein [Geodermatophilus ruber]SFK76999.1 ABC-type nitrate/sulfonate/bicarbonate transport system, substrate-binding protein [Geodermatophilus ruber]
MNRTVAGAKPRKTSKRALVGFGVMALVLAGCGSSDDGATAQAEGPSNRDPQASELETFRVANYRQNGAVPQLAAEREGITEEYGISFEPQWIESSAAGMAALVGSEVDATFSSYTGVIDAARQGIGVRIVAELFREVPNSLTLETLPDSGIEDLADLEGKRVGVVALNTSHDQRINYAMLKEGLDPETVEYVELPFGEMGSSLERGVIDAAVVTGTSLRNVRETLSSRTVLDFGAGIFEEFPSGGWIMRSDFVDENPNAVAAFQCTMIKAQSLVMGNQELYDSVMQEELGFDQEALAITPMLNHPTELDADGIQIVADMMRELGAIDEEFDVESLVVPLPDNC